MTTIALNKDQIACDRQLTHSNGIVFKTESKLMLYENLPHIRFKKFAVGFAGSIETASKILEFFTDIENYKLPKKYESVEFVVLTDTHKMFTFSDPKIWYPIQSKFYAIGSGSHFAMGAMSTGLSPNDAVKAAIKLDKGSGFGSKFITFP